MTTQSLTVRAYEPSDAARVRQIDERALRASPLRDPEDAPAVCNPNSRYLEASGTFLVGLVGGEIVAVGGYRPVDAATVSLERLRVDPARQRSGYGTRLLYELEADARDDGFERALLNTDVRLQAARQLYRRRGYEPIGRESDLETGIELVTFCKEL